MIKKAIIPAAGLGTRLLPLTKEMPKEMLPIFSTGAEGKLAVRPLLQVVFEQLYEVGIREFCFIVGKGKESIAKHFTYDSVFLDTLTEIGKAELGHDLGNFYNMVKSSSLVFIYQTEAKGFGDAVLRAEPYVKKPFLVQAGDTLVLSRKNMHLSRLIKIQEKYESTAVFFVKRVENPEPFGIIEGELVENGVYRVKKTVEKPRNPLSNLAITAYYLFTPEIFSALHSVDYGVAGEIQLTDGIQNLIDSGFEVMAVELGVDEFWLDVGSPNTYWSALNNSYSFARGK